MFINNQLNLNRNQIAAIKRGFQNNKSLYNRISKTRAKIEALSLEYKALVEQTEGWEAPVKAMTKIACGTELNSEQVIHLLQNPEEIKTLPGYGDENPTENSTFEN